MGFLSKRKMIITLDKKDGDEEPTDPDHFQKQFDVALDKLEIFGRKILVGVAAYILMDTWRQVTVERAKHDRDAR